VNTCLKDMSSYMQPNAPSGLPGNSAHDDRSGHLDGWTERDRFEALKP
jgi:hypothetical protein